jgi:hypothetical protein
MLDESLLDDPEALARVDTRGLLLGVAAAGARVRMAARLAAEAGIGALRPDGRPRTVLVAGPGPSAPSAVADLLEALGAGSCPVIPLHPSGPAAYDLRWNLPGWVGPLDLLLVASPAGTEAGLADLIEQAYRRGCTPAGVVPAKSPIAEALEQARGITIPYAKPPAPEEPSTPSEDPGSFWALLTPLLMLTDRIGLLHAPPDAIEAVADRLDEVAAKWPRHRDVQQSGQNPRGRAGRLPPGPVERGRHRRARRPPPRRPDHRARRPPRDHRRAPGGTDRARGPARRRLRRLPRPG